ncbi:hypothetical protein PL373_09325 [Tenacibaculum maritimum]|nr:hypothetical protein [Tenacibaculum maritimum]MDB0601345.1 hypothetical protein [Tenacibaculum maritimum]MDB0611766.1 hypothetical protein [Tenacibaculum maritimum]
MQNTLIHKIEESKLKRFIKKENFYNYFGNYVKDINGMKNEMAEIVQAYRNVPERKSKCVRQFKFPEIRTFIKNNDFERLFLE